MAPSQKSISRARDLDRILRLHSEVMNAGLQVGKRFSSLDGMHADASVHDLEGEFGGLSLRLSFTVSEGVPLSLAVARAASTARISRAGQSGDGVLVLVAELVAGSETEEDYRAPWLLPRNKAVDGSQAGVMRRIARQAVAKGAFDYFLVVARKGALNREGVRNASDSFELAYRQGNVTVLGTAESFRDALDEIRSLAGNLRATQALTISASPGAIYSPHDSESKSGSRRYLLVADEWAPGKGGISSFNLELARALVARGREVCVALPSISDEHALEARQLGIDIALPQTVVPGIDGPANLLTGLRYVTKPSFSPDVVVGHGRFLGPYALALQSAATRRPARVHFVHTDAESLELAKEGVDGEPRTRVAQVRKKVELGLAAEADVVAGVGNRLWAWVNDALIAADPERIGVINFMPGLRDWGGARNPDALPAQRTFLMTARADDYTSKGVLLAVRAVGRVKVARAKPQEAIRLVVRGVPAVHSDLRLKVNEAAQEFGLQVIFREYTEDALEIREDLFTCIALLMPSPHEGFGLSAYEALAAGTPIRVSEESGLHDFLVGLSPDGARSKPREVLPVGGAAYEDEWVNSLMAIINDPKEALRRGLDLRHETQNLDLWGDSIGAMEAALDAAR